MSNYPDFESYGYQIKRELGQNSAGGRVTYLATNTKTQQSVVIKQFQFAQSEASWAGYSAVNSEIQMLRSLSCANIPRYLDSFETPNGFCLVQEYKEAAPLAKIRHFTLQEIKQIAVAVLEVLVDLQKQNPPVIHRDIKPENILVNRSQEKLKVYLVDFGFARLGGGDVAASSVVKGTLGFMPPEQMFNRQLTEASDLYSLGATLSCLLTGTKSTEIGNLIDHETSRLNFQQQVPHLNPQFIDWLEKMVAPRLENRYPNAAVALQALKPIQVVGGAPEMGMLRGLIELGKSARVRELVALSLLALVGINFTISWISGLGGSAKQLLKTGKCIKCNLADVNLEGANLTNADLEMTELMRANLERADLVRANLEGANLEGTDLVYANLGRANLVGANLENAYLEGADLVRANLEGANLEGADLEETDLVRVNLEGANLMRANLEGANLMRANLEGTNLMRANLEGANLVRANLEGADLRRANLKGVNLEGADLEGADLEGTDLEGAILRGTIMPNGTN